jgi:hypothetical protein
MTPISISPLTILLVSFNEPYGVLEDSWSNVLLADANQMGVCFFVAMSVHKLVDAVNMPNSFVLALMV